MSWFLTVTTKTGGYLHWNERHESLEAALQMVSDRYLADAELRCRWAGYFAVRAGEITHLKINRATAGYHLREDVAQIDILSERGHLERETDKDTPDA